MGHLSALRGARFFRVAGTCAVLIWPLVSAAAVDASPSIGGCPVFPANNVWNTDISSLPVHPSSASWIASMGGTTQLLHPDFGPSGGFPYGIPFNVVDSSHPRVNLSFAYSAESDQVAYPFGADTSIEGGPGAGGDRHAIMIEPGSCTLYELYDAHYNGTSPSTAGSGATWSLRGNALRPPTWTSADAAGLPIFPGLLRVEEVQAGAVSHAIRFTAQQTDRSFLWPARHQAGAAGNPALPPMGARFRLRAGFDTSRYGPATRAVLTAMKQYGMILADNGSNWYFQGAAEGGWSDTMISELKTVPAGQFDAINEASLMLDPNSAQARQPGTPPAPPAPPPPPPAATAAPLPVVVPAPSPSPTIDPYMLDPEARRSLARHTSVVTLVAGATRTASKHHGGVTIPAWLLVAVETLGIGLAAWIWRRQAAG
jgi:hypothetical protein